MSLGHFNRPLSATEWDTPTYSRAHVGREKPLRREFLPKLLIAFVARLRSRATNAMYAMLFQLGTTLIFWKSTARAITA